jgi:phosphatidylglycerol---prolipoprotein diacylglyceryl transferase
MLVHPQFDPVAIHLGPIEIRWYGLMYVIGFVVMLVLGRYRIRTRPDLGWSLRELDDLIFYGVIGVILGGRIGYILFYKPDYYLANPGEALKLWQGGMSFHGGFLGALMAVWLFARHRGKHWLAITDFVAPFAAQGIMFGRIGNFLNGELPGRPTNLPWGMVFPQLHDNLPRHPSQLYQAGLEGLALFLILWFFSVKPRPVGAVSGMFLLGYGVFRFLAEFAREPDDFLGLLALGLSMGQWLTLPMIVAGVALLGFSLRSR